MPSQTSFSAAIPGFDWTRPGSCCRSLIWLTVPSWCELRGDLGRSSLSKNLPGEGTGPTGEDVFRGILVGRVPSRGVREFFNRLLEPIQLQFGVGSLPGGREFAIYELGGFVLALA